MHPTRPSRRPLRPFADERGFTLVELLVCLLIFGIMAAIALPAFLDQRAKGEDTEAKLALRTAATALRTFALTEDTFAATRAQLEAIEPALADARNLTVTGDDDEFTITEDSADGTTFEMTRAPTGRITRDCSNPGFGLCRDSVDGAGNRW
jgi:type IV pilus assembly protein PilA